MEIHQKKSGPDYHRLKTMVKRSIEQNPRIKNKPLLSNNTLFSRVLRFLLAVFVWRQASSHQ